MADQNDKSFTATTSNASEDAAPTGTGFSPQGQSSGQNNASDDAAGQAAPAATSTAQTLKEGAAKITQSVGDHAKTYVEDGKSRAGSALDELATMLQDAAGTVEDKVGAQYGQYARSAADAVTGFSESLKAKNVDDLIADATGFVRKSPAIAIGTAAAIGFVLARLVQSGLNADNDRA
ncbi:hypothetical protein ACFOKI_12415 [Sphingomonas qilianensis]|uniref:Uncharacterized protein n=1 Tax=Sphingomonas qilianensis TaxID=1736690 RepID=A0ABU9XNQ0_9SPHN